MLYIVIINENVVKIDLKSLLYSSGDKIILLGSSRCISGLDVKQKDSFDEVVQIDQFEVENLFGIISNFKKNFSKESVIILTNDEVVEHVCALLRKTFGIKIPRYNEVEHLWNKVAAKERLQAVGIRVPRFCSYQPSSFLNSAKYGRYTAWKA